MTSLTIECLRLECSSARVFGQILKDTLDKLKVIRLNDGMHRRFTTLTILKTRDVTILFYNMVSSLDLVVYIIVCALWCVPS